MQKRISAADCGAVRVVIVTLDNHLSSTTDRAATALRKQVPGLTIALHAAATWEENPENLDLCLADIAAGDIIICTMLVMEDHIRAVLPALKARRPHCDAMIGLISAPEVIQLTKLGILSMDGKQGGLVNLLKRLKGSKKPGESSGAKQMTMLRRLPKILRFIPGAAQDLRAYFLTLQYWLAGSEDNVVNMVRLLADRYASGERKGWKGRLPAAAPVDYPDVGVYHPDLPGRMACSAQRLPMRGSQGTVGLLIMRSYVLAGNTRHYDAVIRALEAKGLNVIPAFASGLDARPAIQSFFQAKGRTTIDALVSLTGFSLVGGPAYNNAAAAAEILSQLDVPYLSAQAVEFQSLEQWQQSERGLLPVEATMMLAIPELDGATGSIVFGGRSDGPSVANVNNGLPSKDMVPHLERAAMLASRVAKLIALRKTAPAERKVAIVLFGFPPNAGSTGTAAYLSVYASLLNTLKGMRAAGYSVDVPADEDELRNRILQGNAGQFGTTANVHARISVDDHVRREQHLREIEAQWGPAPGKQQSNGSAIFVLGAQFGNVLVGVQPGFGYEGDPMRLLFEKGFSPTHAFSAFYRYLREDFAADAILHFGTHGALEFMPGKQTALSDRCWPDRLIGDVPNLYLYAANNPSEGTIAKRRSAATLISYLTPSLGQAGLYRGLIELKSSIERWRSLPTEADEERQNLAVLIQAQASLLDLAQSDPAWPDAGTAEIGRLWQDVIELEYTLIPSGLHVVGEGMPAEERIDMLLAMTEAADLNGAVKPSKEIIAKLVAGVKPAELAVALAGKKSENERTFLAKLAVYDRQLATDSELDGILRGLDGRFVPPAPSGDLIRTPAIMPTGRNLHGFDPYRIPSLFAVADGALQADRLLARHKAEGNALPETIALVLWGTDNLKSEGGPIAQALALLGAKPRFDSYGRLCGAELVDLATLGRPRIDVAMTISGIFRDLLPLQTRVLAEASYLAAAADEPLELNFVRKHTLAYQATHGCDLETAALRVFSNADGAYGSNVNQMIESGCWSNEDELAEIYTKRKCFAYGRNGKPSRQTHLMHSIMADVDLAYQNLESVELGVTSVDHYFDTLGGISRAARRASGAAIPVYIGDQTRGEGKVRTLSEQVALESRTRVLNPKWYEGMLKHGYEGVRQIEAHVTNTFGWSATTGQVSPWVYQQISQTFVLDAEMRERLSALNPTASAKVAYRLLEAHERKYWSPDAATLEALRGATDEMEDRLEGIAMEAAA